MGHVFAYAHAHVKRLRWSKILQQSHLDLDLNLSLQLSVKYGATKVCYAHTAIAQRPQGLKIWWF